MYSLTEKGQGELELYSGATEDDLRLTRRTLIVPVLEVIASGNVHTFSDLQDQTGFSRYEMTGILRSMYRLGLIERTPPTSDAPYKERRSWYMFCMGQERGKKPDSRTKEQIVAASKRVRERYPEVVERQLDDFESRGRGKWYERHGGAKEYRRQLRGTQIREGRLVPKPMGRPRKVSGRVQTYKDFLERHGGETAYRQSLKERKGIGELPEVE